MGGQALASPGHQLLIFENALDGTWPPKWRSDAVMQPVRARTWRGGKIIVGFNDNSVTVETLEKAGGFLALPQKITGTAENSSESKLKVLDVEDAPARRP